jgi:hypothetical protein
MPVETGEGTMRSRNRTRRAAATGAVIAVVVLVVVAAAAGGLYLLRSETPARNTGISTGSTVSSQATGSAVSSSSVTSVVATTNSIGAQNLTDLFQNLASGLNEPQYLVGNYSELTYVLSTESLNHTSGLDDYSSTYSVIGPTTPDGVPATKVGLSFTNESTDGGVLRNDTRQYTIDLSWNGTVVQLYNETTHEYEQFLNTDPDTWLLTQSTEEVYGDTIGFFQNSTFLQQVGTSSLTIGSTTLTVSSFTATQAFFSSGTGYVPGDSLTIGIGIAPGTTLHIPTSVVAIGEASPGNSSSWEQVTFTLAGVTTA